MIVNLLTEHHLEFLILKECCRGSPESKVSNCWKSHAVAQIIPARSLDCTYDLLLKQTNTLKIKRSRALCYIVTVIISSCYTMGCPPVRGDNPRALASGLSYVQVDKHGITILYHLHLCRPCTPRDILY